MPVVPLRLGSVREPEYKRLRRKIEAEYREKLVALDMVFAMSGGPSKNSSEESRKSKGAVPSAVRNALLKINSEFDVRDVEKQIKEDIPNSNFKRASISGTLKRLVKGEELVVTSEGKGKRGSKYRRK